MRFSLPRTAARPRPGSRGVHLADAGGFTLVELLMVILLIGVSGAMLVMITRAAIKPTKAESAGARIKSVLQLGREHAITHRRLVRVSFPEPNSISLEEVQLDETVTPITTAVLEEHMQFTAFDGLADTPDLFGNGTATTFTGSAPHSFTSDGMLVDVNGDPSNATLTVGVPGDRHTISAVTIMGVTALVRQWRWNGREWVE